MAAVSRNVVVLSVVAVWAVVVVAAQSQPGTETQDTSASSQAPSAGGCAEMRSKLEDQFYVMYKGRLPRRMFKDLLPLFVEPLLDPECTSGGYAAWLKAHPNGDLSTRPKRAFLGLDFFMPGAGGTRVKDPGDAPAGTVNPFKDPGDRMFGAGAGIMPKDPGDHPRAAASAMSQLSQMMTLAQMMSPRAPMPGNWRARSPPARPNPYSKPMQAGGVYGDTLPGKRKKRSPGDSGDHKDVVTIGDVSMPTDAFKSMVAPDRPDRPDRPDHSYGGSYYQQYPPQPGYYSQPPLQNNYPYARNMYGYQPLQTHLARQVFTRNSDSNQNGRNGMNGKNGVYQNQVYNNRAVVLAQRRLQAALAGQAYYRQQQNGLQNFGNGFAKPFIGNGFAQPFGGNGPVQPFVGNGLPQTFIGNGLAPIGANGPQLNGGTNGARRVKRASEEESSSSDPSPTDVVSIGDLSMPADTFKQMIGPSEEPRRRAFYPPPVYYPPPAYNGNPYGNGYTNGHYNGRNGYRNGYTNGYHNGGNGYRNGYTNGYLNGRNGYRNGYGNGYMNGGRNGYGNGYSNGYGGGYSNGFVPGSNGIPLPMGAAKPLFGNGGVVNGY